MFPGMLRLVNSVKDQLESFLGINIDKRYKCELLIIIILGLVVATWYSSDQIVNWFDYGFSYKPDLSFAKSLYIWDNAGSLGYPNPRVIAGLFPNSIYYLAMDTVGVDLHYSQLIFFYFLLIIPGVNSYYLFRRIEGAAQYNPGAIFCAMTYMFSPYVSTFIFDQYSSGFYSYAFIPLILGLVYGGLKDHRGYRYFLALALIWVFFTTPSYMNPVHAVIDWFIIIGASSIIIFVGKVERGVNVKKILFLFTIWFVLSSYWIIPQIVYFDQIIDSSSVNIINLSNVELLKSNSVPFYKSVFQFGYWGLYNTYMGDHWITWWRWASSPIFVAGCVMLTILSFMSIKFKPRTVLPFLVLLIISLVMINGYYPPTGDVLLRLFEEFPSLYSLRSLVQKFGPVVALSYGVMGGISVGYLYIKIVNINGRLLYKKAVLLISLVVIMTVIVSSFAYPFVTGQVIYRGGDVIPSALVEIPDYYTDANDYFNQDESDFNIFPLPYCKLNYDATNWSSGYWGLDSRPYLIDKSILSRESSDLRLLLIEIADDIANRSAESDVGKMLSIVNVKYIVLFNDTNWDFIQNHEWWASSSTSNDEYYQNLLDLGFIHVDDIGELCIFLNPEWKDIHYYCPEYVIRIPGGIESIKRLSLSDWYSVDRYAFVVDDDIDPDSWEPSDFTTDQYERRDITIVEIDATKRDILFDEPLQIIVFTERYYDDWMLNTEASSVEHIKINGYMNGWIIIGMTGEECTIEFQSQIYFISILILCVISWIALASYVVFLIKRSKNY